MKKDEALGYNQSGAAGFSKLFGKAKAGGKGIFVQYNDEFREGLKGFKPGADKNKIINYAMQNGPPDLRKKLSQAIAQGADGADDVKGIVRNIWMQLVHSQKGGKSAKAAWDKLKLDNPTGFKGMEEVIDDIASGLSTGEISLMDMAMGAIPNFPGNPLMEAGKQTLGGLGIPRQGPPPGRAVDFMENLGGRPLSPNSPFGQQQISDVRRRLGQETHIGPQGPQVPPPEFR